MLPRASVLDTASGRYLLFPGPDFISNTLFRHGRWEPQTLQIADQLLRLSEGPGVIIDAGANVGAFSVPLARAHPGARLVSFEAQRVVFYQLCGAAVLNGLQNLHPMNIALGERAGQVDIPAPAYGRDANIGGVSADAQVRALRGAAVRGTPSDAPGTPSERVEMRPLDSFSFEAVRLLKLDVEGMELAVLRGAADTLKRSGWPPLLFEVWDTAKLPAFSAPQAELLEHVAGLGYGVQRLGDLAIAQHESQRTQVTLETSEGGAVSLSTRTAAG